MVNVCPSWSTYVWLYINDKCYYLFFCLDMAAAIIESLVWCVCLWAAKKWATNRWLACLALFLSLSVCSVRAHFIYINSVYVLPVWLCVFDLTIIIILFQNIKNKKKIKFLNQNPIISNEFRNNNNNNNNKRNFLIILCMVVYGV